MERNEHLARQPSPPAKTGTKLKTPREKLDESVLARINNKVANNKDYAINKKCLPRASC